MVSCDVVRVKKSSVFAEDFLYKSLSLNVSIINI